MTLDKDSLGFITTGGQSPLLHFKGRMVDYKPESREFENPDGSKRMTNSVVFQFTELEVLQSIVPYMLKTTELRIPHSQNGDTQWGVLCKSIERIMGPGVLVSQTVDKVWEVKYTQGHMGRVQDPDSKQWGPGKIDAYEILALDGVTSVSGVSATPAATTQSDDDVLVEIADGKTAVQYGQEVILDARVKASPVLMPRVVTGGDAVLAQLVQQGKLTLDATGVYHKV